MIQTTHSDTESFGTFFFLTVEQQTV